MIKPSIGRVVWFTPATSDFPTAPEPKLSYDGKQPLAAIVTYVHSDTMVNLAVFDTNGTNISCTSVPLHQPENERPTAYFCEWMPYQQAVAKGQIAPTLHAGDQEARK
jgi:hypothetical protein